MPGRLKLLVAALETSVSCILTGTGYPGRQIVWHAVKALKAAWRNAAGSPQDPAPGDTANTGAVRKRPLKGRVVTVSSAAQHQNKAGSKGECSRLHHMQVEILFRAGVVSVLRQTQQCQNTPTFRAQALEPNFCFPPTLHILHPAFLAGLGFHSPYGAPLLSQRGKGIKYCSVSPK